MQHVAALHIDQQLRRRLDLQGCRGWRRRGGRTRVGVRGGSAGARADKRHGDCEKESSGKMHEGAAPQALKSGTALLIPAIASKLNATTAPHLGFCNGIRSPLLPEFGSRCR